MFGAFRDERRARLRHELFETRELLTIDQKLNHVLRVVEALYIQGEHRDMDLTGLLAQVEATKTVEASAVTLIQHLVGELLQNQSDPSAIATIAAELKASSDALAAAIAAVPVDAPPAAPAAPAEPAEPAPTEPAPAPAETAPVDSTPAPEPPAEEPPVVTDGQ